MDRSGFIHKYSCLLVGLFILLGLSSRLSAQWDSLLVMTDTSYFKAGNDNWNLVESVMKRESGNVLFLLRRGADPNATAEGGMTALMFAAESGDTVLVQLLVLNGADTELTKVEGTTPLLVAVLNQNFDVVHYLLQKGANPDQKDEFHVSALLYASAINDYRVADLLLYYGASDTILDKAGNDALMTAVFFKNIETADVLLQNGIQADRRDSSGNTPLMVAAQQGNREMIRLLLEYGSEIDPVNKQNYTPLAHALRYHRDSAAILLVDSGANIHHQLTEKRNLYDLAVQQNQTTIKKLLKEKGVKPIMKPDFSEFDLSWGNSYNGNEYMMQTRISWVDRKFGFYVESGFDFRPSPLKVQLPENDTLLFQYREHRPAWSHGIGKYFILVRDLQGLEYGIYTGISGLLSFPSYRGISEKPAVEYKLIPHAGAFLRGNWAGLRAGAERYSFGTLFERNWKMNITLFMRLPYRQSVEDVYKDIQY